MPAPTKTAAKPRNYFDRFFSAEQRRENAIAEAERQRLSKRLYTKGAAKTREMTEAEKPSSQNVMSLGALEQEVERKKARKKARKKKRAVGGPHPYAKRGRK